LASSHWQRLWLYESTTNGPAVSGSINAGGCLRYLNFIASQGSKVA